jgi:hypothetical protein
MRMNIAVVGWGSLIWCPGSLRIKTRWKKDGPVLPIEFARISRDGRLTLVIHPTSKPLPTYWALSELGELHQACTNLKDREGARRVADIHFLTADGQGTKRIPVGVANEVQAWLAKHADLGAVIWTGLLTNWEEKRGRSFAPADALRYLEELEAERDRATTVYERAQEYLRNAPASIQTEVRGLTHRKGWEDVSLPDILFEG